MLAFRRSLIRWLAIVAAGAGLLPVPAQARLTDIASIAAAPDPSARLPADATFIDQSGAAVTLMDAIGGRPAVLVFADYTCKTLCGPVVSFVADRLRQTGLAPDKDYRFVVIGLDPKDDIAAARRMKRERLDDAPGVQAASRFLSGDRHSIAAVTTAAGFRFAYDADEDQFAHPAAAFVLTPDARVVRVFPGIELAANDLRLALVEGSRGKLGTWRDRVALLCYGFDPAHGVYTLTIRRALMIMAALTVLAMAALIGGLAITSRRAKPS